MVKKTFTLCYIKNILLFKNETSTEKSEYEYLYKMDGVIKGNNFTDENEGIVEYGNDFLNCKIIHPNQKKL